MTLARPSGSLDRVGRIRAANTSTKQDHGTTVAEADEKTPRLRNMA